MNDLLLSVIMPTYNGAQYLPFALESIRNQNSDLMQKIEILVVDDGSTDSTIEILLDYSKDLPIKILRSHREGNWVKGLNEGLRAAKGLFCCQLLALKSPGKHFDPYNLVQMKYRHHRVATVVCIYQMNSCQQYQKRSYIFDHLL